VTETKLPNAAAGAGWMDIRPLAGSGIARRVKVDPAIVPADEEQRLAAVRRYDILDTPPDGAFERLTAIAARHFRVPISIISVVDENRIWFKSARGLEGVSEIGREPGLCASAILQDDVWVVERADLDARTLANPLVAGEFGLRFYAGAPLKTADGHNLGTICVIDRAPREITPEESATLSDLACVVVDELELRLAARREADRLEQTRSDFVVTAAHELRTPLTAVFGAAKTLARSSSDFNGLQRDLVEMIETQSERLNEIVEKVLTAAQLDQGQLPFAREILDPAEIAAAAISAAKATASPSHTLALTVREPLPKVQTDGMRLRQLLANLLENAIKYSPEGGRVELEVESRSGRVRFHVHDEGIGIAVEHQSRIFDKFVRVDPMLVSGIAGTGLGLHIASKFLQHMGGALSVSSMPGKGSTFTAELPAASI
jgi:signal transduction histidine kinase